MAAEDLTPAVAAMPVAGTINRGFGMFLVACKS